MSFIIIYTLILVSWQDAVSSAEISASTQRRHRQRLPSDVNAILARMSPSEEVVAAIVTNSPTEDIFGTRAPTSKPTASPTISFSPSILSLPTSVKPSTAAPIEPPTAPFPTYKPTDGTTSPTLGTDT